MSLSDQVLAGIRIARVNLGDLLVKASLIRVTGPKVYNTSTGTYTVPTETIEVDGFVDKFSFSELQAQDFLQTDVKFVVFNTENELNITTADSIEFAGVRRSIIAVKPEYVGIYKPVIALTLRK